MSRPRGSKNKPKLIVTDNTSAAESTRQEIFASMPLAIEDESRASLARASSPTRRNKVSSTGYSVSENYQNIKNAQSPFLIEGTTITIRDAVDLSQKAYWNIPIVKQTIDTLTDLCNSEILLKGSNQKVKDFINAWFEKINIWKLKQNFFLEMFRSSNIFLYRMDSEFREEDFKKLTQIYGARGKKTIPTRYMILNPKDVCASAGLNYLDMQYYKVLSQVELLRLKNPKTQEDKDILSNFSEEMQKEIKFGANPMIPLEAEKLYVVLYKALDYEPFGLPMVFPVLGDLNWKMELQNIDRAIARTTDWSILLMTMGGELKDGSIINNEKAMQTMQSMFQNESVKRVLVCDWTTKGQWLIPDINKILGPEKYQIVEKDIAIGLNAILFGEGEKFANTSIKVQILIERLKEARNSFINDFLQPEIKRICGELGFKNYPEVYFEEISLQDELQYQRIYTRLMELGVLTPDEGLQAMQTGELPTPEDSIVNQRRYLEQRKAGYYNPLVGGLPMYEATDPEQSDTPAAPTKVSKPTGRPVDSGTPQSTKNVKPIGTRGGFSMKEMQKILVASTKLDEKMEKVLLKKHGLKELNDVQQKMAHTLANVIMVNEKLESWESKVKEYVENPKEADLSEVEKICVEHNVNDREGIILKLSRIEE